MNAAGWACLGLALGNDNGARLVTFYSRLSNLHSQLDAGGACVVYEVIIRSKTLPIFFVFFSFSFFFPNKTATG